MSLPTLTMSGKQLLAREAPHVRAELPEAGLHLVCDEDAAGLAHHLHGHLGDRGTIAPEVIEAFGKRIRYFNTFGGNPRPSPWPMRF